MDSLDDSGLNPSEVSARIRREHALLRPLLRETHYLAERLADGNAEALNPLRAFTIMLYEKLAAHIDLEDRILAPAVREIIGWGRSLHESMVEEHAHQREHLRRDIIELKRGTLPADELAARVESLVTALMRDMDAEERRLLRSDLLDDSLLSDGECG